MTEIENRFGDGIGGVEIDGSDSVLGIAEVLSPRVLQEGINAFYNVIPENP